MWSFAVILWEMHTREIPFGNYLAMQSGILVILYNLYDYNEYMFEIIVLNFKITIESMRLKLPSSMPVHLQKLIKICINEDPQKRPKFEMILPILEKLKNNSSK